MSGIMGIFHRKTPAEQLRENKRMIERSIRELDRERTKLEQQEKKTIADLKKVAKAGQREAAQIMAKDLVRNRAYVANFYKMRAQLQGVSMQLTSMRSQQAMAQAMGGVTMTMRQMNRSMNLPAMRKIMMEFERQNEIMGIKSEMMEDSMEDAMGDDMATEEETENIVNQVFEEIGVSFNESMVSAPTTNKQMNKETETQSADADLQARLESLRRL